MSRWSNALCCPYRTTRGAQCQRVCSEGESRSSWMAPKPPTRWAKHRSPNRPTRFLILLCAATAFILVFLSLHVTAALLRLANSLGRQCMPLPSEFPTEDAASPRRRIAMVSLSDEGAGGPQRRRRAFQGLTAAAQGNKKAYAARMGYRYIDAGDLVDRSRPPNWSKILAVRAHLPHYDWVFWNDAVSSLQPL